MPRARLLPCFGAVLVATAALLALLAPVICRQDPQAMELSQRLLPPSAAHWFGQDDNGADVLTRVLFGARVSLSVAWTVMLIGCTVGVTLGCWAGYRGGWVDQVLMRVVDMFYAFPSFLLALSLVAVLGPSLRNLVFALALTSWTGFARLARAEILHLKEREFVLSAKAIGCANSRILTVHLLPNLLGILTVQATSVMAATIIAEAGLSYLGLGVPPGIPTWGSMLSAGRRVLGEAPHLSLAPGLAIVILVLSFNLLGDGVRDSLDPRRARLKN